VSKKTLPQGAASGALYVLAVAAGVLLSKPVAVVLATLATLVLLLTVAGTRAVQRHLSILGRLPLVEDHRFYAQRRPRARVAVPSQAEPLSKPPPAPSQPFDAEMHALLSHGRGSVSDRYLMGTDSLVRQSAQRDEHLRWKRDVISGLQRRDPAAAKRFMAASSLQEQLAILADYLGVEKA
jgi:hypothetical protein